MQHYESRIGEVLHILGKQFFNTFPWGCKSRALDTDIQFLSGIIARVWKKGLNAEEHELVRCTVHELDFHKYPGSSPTRHFHVLGPAAVASERPVETRMAFIFEELISKLKGWGNGLLIFRKSDFYCPIMGNTNLPARAIVPLLPHPPCSSVSPCGVCSLFLWVPGSVTQQPRRVG